MNLDFFGPGEYPYKTILLETTCESIGYVLKNRGYGTHAIHNNDGTFYGRHLVFPNLGFDSFTSVEYMNNVIRTPLAWAKDSILTGEIRKALDSTEEPDFVYTISVQGHGSYPDKEVLTDPAVDLTLPEHLSALYYPLLYYTNQIYEMDQFVAELIEMLEERGEDTVLVMYGDHLPGFKLTEEDLGGTSQFATQYVVWSNFSSYDSFGSKKTGSGSVPALFLCARPPEYPRRYHKRLPPDTKGLRPLSGGTGNTGI